ncbi:MAG TPA: mannonate dehydratase [Candidatus Didemnitutus sp.]|jgi:mannonate dehydratase
MIPNDLPLMEEAMRWFGPADTVSLAEIRQTGATSVFTALHEIPYGEEWPQAAIDQRRNVIEAAGLGWAAVESVPVHESIKTRTGDFARCIANYQLTLRRLGAAGIRTVIYNFMPVLDWVRTDLHHRLPDGAEALLYDPAKFAAFELFALERPGAGADFTPQQCADARKYWENTPPAERAAFFQQILDLFPGVKLNLGIDDLRRMLGAYASITAEQLKEHLRLFVREIAPVAAEAGIRLAIHPDDPPFPLLGLPRIVSTGADLADILAMADTPANGLCFCTGSLGGRLDNDLPALARRFASRINAVHLRSVVHRPDGIFFEGAHLDRAPDMVGVVRAIVEEQARRRTAKRTDWQVAFRPDHGHKIADDFRRAEPACPGYPLIGRLRGLAELRGLQLGIASSL